MIPLALSKRVAIGVLFVFICIAAHHVSVAVSATGTDGPVISPAPDTAPAIPSARILSPAPPPGWTPFTFTGEITSLWINSAGGLDKGSILTDLGMRLAPARPNALESVKLEMAREAIEASRAAGTLPVDLAPAAEALPSSELRKTDATAVIPATPPKPDPPACVGDIPPLQLPGPGDLAPAELEKLQTLPPEAGANAADDGEGS